MTTRLRQQWGPVLVAAGLATLLAGCSTEYHGHHSGIDGVLARQIASFEDPLSRSIYQPMANDPRDYLDALEGARWVDSGSVCDLELQDGGVVLYDISSTGSAAELSVFIASGVRPDVPTDDGRHYSGPTTVFTCYGIETEFRPGAEPTVDRTIFTECPAALVELLPSGAAFASGEVFDG